MNIPEQIVQKMSEYHVVQKEYHDCGVGTMQMVRNMMRLPCLAYNDLSRMLGASEQIGVSSWRMTRHLRFAGVRHRERDGMPMRRLVRGLDDGFVYVVSYQQVADGDREVGPPGQYVWDRNSVSLQHPDHIDGHYSLVFAASPETIWCADPAMDYALVGLPRGIRPIPRRMFEDRWIDMDLDDGKILDHWAIELA